MKLCLHEQRQNDYWTGDRICKVDIFGVLFLSKDVPGLKKGREQMQLKPVLVCFSDEHLESGTTPKMQNHQEY